MDNETREEALIEAEEAGALQATEEDVRSYWAKSASRYTLASRILIVALVLFLFFFAMFYSATFSYDSFYYFIKDMGALAAATPGQAEAIYFTPDDGECVPLSFRGGVAHVGTGGVEIYSADGQRLLRSTRELLQPRAEASRKYLVAYDLGGTEFSVYNSYAELYHGSTQAPILSCAVADSGHFLLVTRSDRSLSRVLLYDADFNLIQSFERGSATLDAAISPNGKRVALAGVTVNAGAVETHLDIYEVEHTEPKTSLLYKGETPLCIEFTGTRQLVLVTSRALYALHSDGKQYQKISFDGALPTAITTGEERVALALKSDSGTAPYHLLALDKKGDVLYDGAFAGEVFDLCVTEQSLYLLSGELVTKIDYPDGNTSTRPIAAGAVGLSYYEKKQVRIFYAGYVTSALFEN